MKNQSIIFSVSLETFSAHPEEMFFPSSLETFSAHPEEMFFPSSLETAYGLLGTNGKNIDRGARDERKNIYRGARDERKTFIEGEDEAMVIAGFVNEKNIIIKEIKNADRKINSTRYLKKFRTLPIKSM